MKRNGKYAPYRLKAMSVNNCDFQHLHGVQYTPGEIATRWAFHGPYSVKAIDEATFEISTTAGSPLVREIWEKAES